VAHKFENDPRLSGKVSSEGKSKSRRKKL
jgi:hypothetical protein